MDSREQRGPDFAVVSVKPKGDAKPLDTIEQSFLIQVARSAGNGRFEMEAVPVAVLIEVAFQIREDQIHGLPAWATAKAFEVRAHSDRGESFDQMRPMLQTLLAERFGLVYHMQPGSAPAYELVVANKGLQLRETEVAKCRLSGPMSAALTESGQVDRAPACGGFTKRVMPGSHGPVEQLTGYGMTMGELADVLSSELNNTVVDGTNKQGRYDLQFTYALEEGAAARFLQQTPMTTDHDNDGPEGSSIFTALKEQAGLQLRKTKTQQQQFFVDSLRLPTPN